MFDMAVASSALSQSSEGLQALLRDHPELVSSSLSRAAGPGYTEVSESTRGSRHGSQPGTPAEEIGSLDGDHDVHRAPSVGEGGPNLGATGEWIVAGENVARERLKRSVHRNDAEFIDTGFLLFTLLRCMNHTDIHPHDPFPPSTIWLLISFHGP